MPGKQSSFVARWAPSICGLVMVCVSIAHRMQLDASDPSAYISGTVLGIEIVVLLVLLFLLFLVAPVRGIYLSFQKRWRDLGVLTLNFLIGLVCLMASIAIDAPTLLYAT